MHLSITEQAYLLSLNRTSLYYKPVPIDDEEYRIKWIIDEIYTMHPEYGYRRMTAILNRDYGITINRKRTRRYMREMGIHGFCPGPNLSKRIHVKYLYPYLLRAMIDWYSRFIVGYTMSNTIDRTFVLETIRKAVRQHGTPEIMNCDQGSQFTNEDYIELLKEHNIKIYNVLHRAED